MEFFRGKAPKRKAKPKSNPFETHDEYLRVKALIANGKMTPEEEIGITLDPRDAEELGLKHPSRVAADSLRQFIKKLGLSAEYHVQRRTTEEPGKTAVVVFYEPPLTATKRSRR